MLRKALAAKFKDNLDEAGGVAARLASLKPKADSGKFKKAKADETAKSKKAKKNLKKRHKFLLAVQSGRLGKNRLLYLARRLAKRDAKKKAQAAQVGEKLSAAGVLGEAGGPLTNKQVRLVASDMPDLLRNSTATVRTHYSNGLATAELMSGSIRTYPELDLYELTGQEKLPMPEQLPNLNTVQKHQQEACLAASGGQLDTKLKRESLLESPELAAGWHEIGFRANSAGDVWPNPMAVCLNAQEVDYYLLNYGRSPGSAESRQAVALLQGECNQLLTATDQKGFIQLPLNAGGHWTLLTFHRRPEQPKLQVMYRGVLPKLREEA